MSTDRINFFSSEKRCLEFEQQAVNLSLLYVSYHSQKKHLLCSHDWCYSQIIHSLHYWVSEIDDLIILFVFLGTIFERMMKTNFIPTYLSITLLMLFVCKRKSFIVNEFQRFHSVLVSCAPDQTTIPLFFLIYSFSFFFLHLYSLIINKSQLSGFSANEFNPSVLQLTIFHDRFLLQKFVQINIQMEN